ncbi:hypothetical protein B0H17DRAFT_1210127 [Mycena rosella]|uniref:Uncharacterized protein n=1 Tax=Mycena rosella TaxID=1033263 RepID=A0AAD7CWX7_MYCRO|nr:hypothetical protein B0H17DRAFT_1210127 [Mycena rosella]
MSSLPLAADRHRRGSRTRPVWMAFPDAAADARMSPSGSSSAPLRATPQHLIERTAGLVKHVLPDFGLPHDAHPKPGAGDVDRASDSSYLASSCPCTMCGQGVRGVKFLVVAGGGAGSSRTPQDKHLPARHPTHSPHHLNSPDPHQLAHLYALARAPHVVRLPQETVVANAEDPITRLAPSTCWHVPENTPPVITHDAPVSHTARALSEPRSHTPSEISRAIARLDRREPGMHHRMPTRDAIGQWRASTTTDNRFIASTPITHIQSAGSDAEFVEFGAYNLCALLVFIGWVDWGMGARRYGTDPGNDALDYL